MTKTVLVTGATGKTGARTVTELLGQNRHRVRALVRKTDSRSAQMAALGAEIVVGDFLDFAAIKRALAGVDSAYFCYPIAPGLIEATSYFAQAAHEASVGAIINMSQITARRDAVSDQARQHWISEGIFNRAGVPVTHLRPTFFADLITTFSRGIVQAGVLRLPFGQGRHAPIPAADQARMVATLLDNPAGHAGQTYKLCGPVELDHNQIATEITRALNRPVRYEQVSIAAFSQFLRQVGESEHLIQHLSAVTVDYENGVHAGTDDIIERVTGTAPMTVEAFVAANRSVFG